MRPSERVDHLTETRDRFAAISAGYLHAVNKLDEFQGGFKAGGFGSGGGGASVTVNGKTGEEEASLTLVEQGCDWATRELENFDRQLEAMLKAAKEAHRVMLVATSFEKLEEQIEWCRSCLRMVNHKGEPHHSPVASDHLCRWCGDYKRQYNRLPDVRILEYRARYGRVTEQVVKRYTQGATA